MHRLAWLPCLMLGIAAIGGTGAPSASAGALPGNGQIAFVDTSTGSPSIGIANADGSARRQLTRTLPFVGQPAWDPQGNRIAFVLGNRIALIRPDGSGLRRVGSPSLAERAPRWSASGELAFVRERSVEGNTGSLLVVARADGSQQRLLPIPEGVVEPESFAWSMDGRHVLWVVPRGSVAFGALASVDVHSGVTTTRPMPTRCALPAVEQPHGPLSVCLDADSSPRLKLLRAGRLVRLIPELGQDAAQPAWNPAGTRLAYGIDRQHVAVLTLASGRTRRFAAPMRGPDGAAAVSWSPDGHRLVVGANEGGGWKVAEVDAGSGSVRTVIAHSEDSSPRFSPDGTRLAFVHTPASGPRQLRMIHGQTRTLALGVAIDRQQLHLPAYFNWSPDSTTIAYTTTGSALATVDVAAKTRRTLARPATGQPFWSPDGSTIAYDATAALGQQPGYGRVRFVLADGSAASLATLAGPLVVLGWTPDGTGVVVTDGGETTQPSIVAAATGTTVSTFGFPGWLGSSLSPDGTRILLTRLEDHEGYSYSISFQYEDGRPSGTTPVSSAPPVWSPDGAAIAFTVGYGSDPGAIQVAPASNLDALGTAIPDASEPSWQPVPGA